MSGSLLAASAYNRASVPVLGEWVNRTPVNTVTDGLNVGYMSKIGSTISAILPGGSGSSRAIYSTNNGSSWTQVSNFATQWGAGVIGSTSNDVTYRDVGGIHMLLGTRGIVQQIGFTTDGITWPSTYSNYLIATSRVNGDAKYDYNGSLFVAVGASANISTSSASPPTTNNDWSLPQAGINTLLGGSFRLQGVKWNGSRWVVLSSGTGSVKGITSTNGTTWSSIPSLNSLAAGVTNFYNLDLANGKLFAIVDSAPDMTPGMYFSNDGLTWVNTNVSSVFGAQLNQVIWNPERQEYAAAAENATVGFSSDGITWTTDTSLGTLWGSTSLSVWSILWTGTNYIVGGGSGRIATKSLI